MTPLVPGEVLEERWRIVSILRKGPLSTVFVADDLETKREAVVKALAASLAREADAVIRFDRECQVLAHLEHPHLVRLIGAGWRGVTPWIVMPRLHGHTLMHEIEQGRVPHARVLKVLEQLGAALQFLHDNGLVHRDVKPGNVFVGEDDHVTLLDMGLVHDANGPLLTRPGQKLGTVAYMAPEQIDGGPVDARTDVYALGVVVFELLSGRLPFDGHEHQILRSHQVVPPPLLSDVEHDVPQGLASAVQRAMAKDAAARFATVDDFVARVRLFLETPATSRLDDAPLRPPRR